MITELTWFFLGIAIGFAFSTKERRKKILDKLNDWTKPKEQVKDRPKE